MLDKLYIHVPSLVSAIGHSMPYSCLHVLMRTLNTSNISPDPTDTDTGALPHFRFIMYHAGSLRDRPSLNLSIRVDWTHSGVDVLRNIINAEYMSHISSLHVSHPVFHSFEAWRVVSDSFQHLSSLHIRSVPAVPRRVATACEIAGSLLAALHMEHDAPLFPHLAEIVLDHIDLANDAFVAEAYQLSSLSRRVTLKIVSCHVPKHLLRALQSSFGPDNVVVENNGALPEMVYRDGIFEDPYDTRQAMFWKEYFDGPS